MLPVLSDIAFPGIRPGTTYIVGGSVRDALLGRPALDTDIAVVGNPQTFARQLADRLSGRYVRIGKSELTIHRVVVGPRIFDVSALHPGGIDDDLNCRDFTLNALAVDAATGELIDRSGGRRDLEAGTIRMVSQQVFDADPIRLVRAYRLSADLRFAIEPGTRKAIAGSARLISRSAGERIWAELRKIFSTATSVVTIERMAQDGVLTAIFPELAPLRACVQGGHHSFDVFSHSLKAYAHLEALLTETDHWLPADLPHALWHPQQIPAAVLKLAMLLHDVGKPSARQADESGRVHFYGHGRKGAEIASGITSRLKMSRRDSDYVHFIIRSHIRPLHLFSAHCSNDLTDRAKARFFARCGPRTPDLLLHCMADIMGKGDNDERNRRFIRFARQLMQQYLLDFLPRSALDPLLDGHALMKRFGLPPSPLVGKLLRTIRGAQLAGDIQSRDQALEMAESLLSDYRPAEESGR